MICRLLSSLENLVVASRNESFKKSDVDFRTVLFAKLKNYTLVKREKHKALKFRHLTYFSYLRDSGIPIILTDGCD